MILYKIHVVFTGYVAVQIHTLSRTYHLRRIHRSYVIHTSSVHCTPLSDMKKHCHSEEWNCLLVVGHYYIATCVECNAVKSIIVVT